MSVRQTTLVPGTFQTPNEYVDDLLPILTGTETKVLLFITRKTLGWSKHWETLTVAAIKKAVGGGRTAVSSALNHLVEMGIVEREGVSGHEFRYTLQLDKALFRLPDGAGGCVESEHPAPGPIQRTGCPHPEDRMGTQPEDRMGTPYTLNPTVKPKKETQETRGVNSAPPRDVPERVPAREATAPARPDLRKPSQRLAAEQEASASWRALCRVADSAPLPGVEFERWTAAWRNWQDWAARAGCDDAALGAEIVARAGRYGRKYTVPFSVPALAANWSALARDAPPAPAAPLTGEALIAAQPERTRHNIEAGQRFLERHGDGPGTFLRAADLALGGGQQEALGRADRALVAEVWPGGRGDFRGGG